MFKKLSFALYLSSAIIITLGLSISLQSLLAAWTAPASIAPGGNVYPPINEGSTQQTKIGRFNAQTGGFWDLLAGGNVQFGSSTAPASLTVFGNVGIGITSPLGKLHTYSAKNGSYNIFETANYGGIKLIIRSLYFKKV